MEPEEINNRFNSELQQHIARDLPKGHIYKLGNPKDILQQAGIPDLPIELNAATLAEKSGPSYKNSHPFELSEIKDLPNAIQDPIMVFDSKTRKRSKVILIELQSKGINFVVAIEMNYKKGSNNNVVEINSIRSVYPKNQLLDTILNWHNNGLLLYVNKKKALAFTSQLRSNSAEVVEKTKASIYNIIKNFANGK